MCTQYITTKSVTEIARLFTARERGPFPRVDAELFPGRVGPVVGTSAEGERGVAAMRWGWPPPAGVRGPVVNVRNLASPFWRSALANPARRCLVPVSRFCEWGVDPDTGKKRRYWFELRDREMFAFAGVWRGVSAAPPGASASGGSASPGAEGAREPVYAFLTCAPNALVGAVHPKAMPLILHEADYDAWLQAPFAAAEQLVAPYPDDAMRMVDETTNT